MIDYIALYGLKWLSRNKSQVNLLLTAFSQVLMFLFKADKTIPSSRSS